MTDDFQQRMALLPLLNIKDSDIRILNLEQCRDAVDKGLHAGGAFSARNPASRPLLRRISESRHRRSYAPRPGHIHAE